MVVLPKLKVAGSNPVSRSILSRFACASWSKCGPRGVSAEKGRDLLNGKRDYILGM